jgi:hypothetical protein
LAKIYLIVGYKHSSVRKLNDKLRELGIASSVKNLRRKKSKSCFSCPYIYIRPAFPILLFDRSKSLNYWHCWNKNPKLSKESVDKKLLVIASYFKFVKFLRKKYKF